MPTKPTSDYNEWVTPSIAARSLFKNALTVQRITQMCRQGVFPSAYRPGAGAHAHWRIRKSEILAHLVNSHVKPE